MEAPGSTYSLANLKRPIRKPSINAQLLVVLEALRSQLGSLPPLLAHGNTLSRGTSSPSAQPPAPLRSVSLIHEETDTSTTDIGLTDYLSELLWAREECKRTLRWLKEQPGKGTSIAQLQCIDQIRKLSADIEKEREKRDKGGYVSKDELQGLLGRILAALDAFPEARRAVQEAMDRR